MTQVKFKSLANATEAAIKLSRESELKYAAIIFSRGEYYVEDSVQMVRSWEEQIASYSDGELIGE